MAEFDGICSAHAMVVRARPDMVLPEFLPFLMMSNRFTEPGGSRFPSVRLSPTINLENTQGWEGSLASRRSISSAAMRKS